MKEPSITAGFSFVVNKKGYCGPKEAQKAFNEYISNPSEENVTKLTNSFKDFESLYPYLKAIAKKHGKKYSDPEVIEAYWIGNSLLDSFTDSDMRDIIESLVERGLPRILAENRKENMPSGLKPMHAAHVLYIGVGHVTGSVETNLVNMNKCIIKPAIVKEIKENALIVTEKPLMTKDKKILVSENEKELEVEYIKELLPNLKEGDVVAIHWEFAAKILTEKEQKQLKHYTEKTIKTINS